MADVHMGSEHGWMHYHEVAARCRHCHRPSLLLVRLSRYEDREKYGADGTVTAWKGDISAFFEFRRAISIADLAAKAAPEHLPVDIDRAFKEGTRCLAIGCHNAAAAMFRLCLDLATKARLPEVGAAGGPNHHQRKNLAPRLAWLFEQMRLPEDLQELSTAVKDYGNDGAHDGTLDDNESDDLYDFAYAVLDRLYTQPKRVAQMRERRDERRVKTQSA